MSKLYEHIARENFKSSGYLSQPGRGGRSRWTFTAPPRFSPGGSDEVRDALQRRERALHRQNAKPTLFHELLNVLLHR